MQDQNAPVCYLIFLALSIASENSQIEIKVNISDNTIRSPLEKTSCEIASLGMGNLLPEQFSHSQLPEEMSSFKWKTSKGPLTQWGWRQWRPTGHPKQVLQRCCPSKQGNRPPHSIPASLWWASDPSQDKVKLSILLPLQSTIGAGRGAGCSQCCATGMQTWPLPGSQVLLLCRCGAGLWHSCAFIFGV